MRIGDFAFEPGLIPSVAALAALPILIALGVWQLQRAEFKEALTADRERARIAEPVPLTALASDWEQARYRGVEVRGRYRPDRQVLLDNQIYQGRPGYWVLTVFEPEALDRAVLVNRGWVPLQADRSVLPAVDVAADSRMVSGYLDRPPRPGLRLGDSLVSGEGWPLVVLELDYEQLEMRLGGPLIPMLLYLSEQAPDGFERNWRVSPGFGSDAHRGYALQWFSLAAAVVVLYLVLNSRRISAKRDVWNG